MNTLEKLRAVQQKRCKAVNVGGVEVVLAPMTAADGLAVQKRFAHVEGFTANDPAVFDFYIELIAVCAVEPGTTAKALDSEEGRALVRALPAHDQLSLGAAAAEINGFMQPKASSSAKKASKKKS